MMNMTPLPPDYTIGNGTRELSAIGNITTDLTVTLAELVNHCPHGEDDAHVKTTLDWAYQIAFLEKLNFSDALRAAMIFYFG